MYIHLVYSKKSTSVVAIAYCFSGGRHMGFQVFFGDHIALQCFVRMCDKNSNTLTVTQIYLCNSLYVLWCLNCIYIFVWKSFKDNFPSVLGLIGDFQLMQLDHQVFSDFGKLVLGPMPKSYFTVRRCKQAFKTKLHIQCTKAGYKLFQKPYR